LTDTFFKAHGLGNDYIALEAELLPFELTPPAVRLLCDRHRGVGSDGILVLVPTSAADFGVRIFNPDGSEAEKSGNGLRIFAVFLSMRGMLGGRTRFTVETPGGVVEIEMISAGEDGTWMIEVEMGRAEFVSTAVGLAGVERDTTVEVLDLAGAAVEVTAVSLGNPHCVVFQDALDEEDFRSRASRLATHVSFERGANVQFARVAGPGLVEALIWERGAGETLASGSSACAVAAAAVRRGLIGQRRVEVRMPGGSLEVEVREDGTVRLRGPVEDVFEGELSAGMVNRLEQVSRWP
jgi:diaminopimelate epimerase